MSADGRKDQDVMDLKSPAVLEFGPGTLVAVILPTGPDPGVQLGQAHRLESEEIRDIGNPMMEIEDRKSCPTGQKERALDLRMSEKTLQDFPVPSRRVVSLIFLERVHRPGRSFAIFSGHKATTSIRARPRRSL